MAQVSSSMVLEATIIESVIFASFLLMLLLSLLVLWGVFLRFCCCENENSKFTRSHRWMYTTLFSVIVLLCLRLGESSVTVAMSIFYPTNQTIQNIIVAIQMGIIPVNTWILICVIAMSLSVTNHLMGNKRSLIICWGVFAVGASMLLIVTIGAIASSVIFEALKVVVTPGKFPTFFTIDRAWIFTAYVALPIYLAIHTLIAVAGIGHLIYVYHNKVDKQRRRNRKQGDRRDSTDPLHVKAHSEEKKSRKKYAYILTSFALVEFMFLMGVLLKLIPDVMMAIDNLKIPRYVLNIFLRYTSEILPVFAVLLLLWPYSVHESCVPVVSIMLNLQVKHGKIVSSFRKKSHKELRKELKNQSAYITPEAVADGTVDTSPSWRTLFNMTMSEIPHVETFRSDNETEKELESPRTDRQLGVVWDTPEV
jgi:uncharacterized membrane protein